MTRRVDPAGQTFCQAAHIYGPSDPPAWRTWADHMRTTHTLTDCPDCGAAAIWRPKNTPDGAEPLQLEFGAGMVDLDTLDTT